ncbi:integrase arm-type DNA-binding domain-containing protein [Sphingomonas sp. AP4-R1]|uniref:tyrosine-type recombinase/integrase n=1 Tax=Sphingomonas sp. AP4-R1 TaxID=2735134 RepID=UPI0014934539|nr:integrase arm-type DNA-binding domain-containing protein [Sphingomonas sp. AP4-R1]QJU58359.1 integrase arm-type DNA-binding domain-containing protein [Sphingomonas sp. AP4-R1]
MALKELEARYATKRSKDYKLADGGGLYLLVRPTGSKLWRMKYRFADREKLLSFGRYPDLSLADARLKRAEAKLALAAGRDPGAKETAPAGKTFEETATAWHQNRVEALDEAHANRIMARLKRDAFPALGAMSLRQIKPADVLAMIRSVEARGALDVSRRLKQHVSQVYRFAIPQGWADSDPAAYLSDLLKPKPRVRHMPRVGIDELPALVRAIDGYDGEENPKRRAITRAALLFTRLTWARTSETRLATWAEIKRLDGPEPIWRMPPDRMKMEREHIVPLSTQAVDLLKTLRAHSRSAFLFPGERPDKPLSQNTMIYRFYRMGYRGRQTVHGFRGLASTWANEAECYRPDWIEMALAHADEDEIRSAYNSALYLSPRRRMLQDWADSINRMVQGGKAASSSSEMAHLMAR